MVDPRAEHQESGPVTIGSTTATVTRGASSCSSAFIRRLLRGRQPFKNCYGATIAPVKQLQQGC
eukprot:11898900-Alexandrium_andersonii.AAC.1